MSERAIVPVDAREQSLMLSRAEMSQLSHSAEVNTRAEIVAAKRGARAGARGHIHNMRSLGILEQDPELSEEDKQDIRDAVSGNIERHRAQH